MLAPLIVVALAVSIAAIGWATVRHRKPGPLLLTLAGAVLIVCGRFLSGVRVLVIVGSVALFAASLWNVWIKRRRRAPAAMPAPALPR